MSKINVKSGNLRGLLIDSLVAKHLCRDISHSYYLFQAAWAKGKL